MDAPIYIRKSGEDKVKLLAIVVLSRETTTHVEFRAQEYFSVHLHSHYYLKRKTPMGLLGLWLIEFPNASELEPPYTYIATLIEKYRDIAEDWVSDE